MSYGSTIGQRRKTRGLTQRQLAERASISLSLLRKIERDARRPSLATVRALATALDVIAGELLQDQPIVDGDRGHHSAEPNDWLGPAIRRAREAHQLTRRRLADAAGISVVFLKKIEAGQRKPSLDTLSSLAAGLDLAPHELLGGTVPIDGGLSPKSRWFDVHVTDLVEIVDTPLSSEPVTAASLLADSYCLNRDGQWLAAAEKAKQASELSRYGSDEWVEAKLRAALMLQQASQRNDALDQILAVEQSLQEVDDPSPQAQALTRNRRGWIADELEGQFRNALQLFDESLPYAQEAAAPGLVSDVHHFRLRALNEQAMTEGDAWLEAAPRTRMSAKTVGELQVSLTYDWPAALEPGEDNLHHYLRRFMAEAVLNQRDALQRLHDHEGIFESWDVGYLIDLSEARVANSEHDWKAAQKNGRRGLEGYARHHFPQGMAMAAAVEAHARLNSGAIITAESTAYECLDLWILSLLLHPYPTHPLAQAACSGFIKALSELEFGQGSWARNYASSHLGARIHERDGVFQLLGHVHHDLPENLESLIRASQIRR